MKRKNETITNYKIIEEIGRGASGVVYLSKYNLNYRDKKVIKEIITTRMTSNELREVENEIKILQILKSNYIIKYYDFKKLKSKIQILLEYAEKGSIKDYIFKLKNKRIEENIIIKWITQILNALKELSIKNVIHRDIKSDNVFLNKDMSIKWGDFGVSKISKEYSNTFVGTPYYISPEIINGEKYNFKTDIWSLGIMIYEILNDKYPFDAPSIPMLAFKILKGKYDKPNNKYSKELNDLCYSMLTVNQIQRPSVDQLMGYKLIKNPNIFKNKNSENKKTFNNFKINSLNPKNINKNFKKKKKIHISIEKKEEKNDEINNDGLNLLNLVNSIDLKQGSTVFKYEDEEKIKDNDIKDIIFKEKKFDYDGFTVSKSQLIDITEEISLDNKKIEDLLYSKEIELGKEKFTVLYETIITFLDNDDNQNLNNNFEKEIYNQFKNKKKNESLEYKEIMDITNIILNQKINNKIN